MHGETAVATVLLTSSLDLAYDWAERRGPIRV